MFNTISQGFTELKKRTNITDLQTDSVSSTHNNIRDHLNNEFTVLGDFLSGSYSRETLVAPLSSSDIDIFIVLHSDYFEQDGQANLLDRIKRSLKKKYPKTPEISRNGQAVTITFTSYMVDVVPSFNRKGGGYLIPNTYTPSWIPTDPKKHISLSSEYNEAHQYMLVPLIKMIKAWNKTISNHFGSFHLEILAWSILNNVTITDYPSGVRYYFDKGRELITKENLDPAGYGKDVGYYLDSRQKIDDAVSRFETAYARAIKAETYAKNNKISEAYLEWRKIFGEYFPTYG